MLAAIICLILGFLGGVLVGQNNSRKSIMKTVDSEIASAKQSGIAAISQTLTNLKAKL